MNNKYFMNLALKQAEKGIGYTSPNPLVGAVIVKDGKIIGKGFHKKFGFAHAEINALAKAENNKGTTLYVTLEPCCHHGKTPPCTDAILKSGIRKVVVGMLDPNPLVSGKGVKILKSKGIAVEIENLDGKIDIFYESFKKFITTEMPFVTLKMAMTLDGKSATSTGDSKWISSKKSRILVHQIRKRSDAILVGVGTVIKDNPKLTPYLIKSSFPKPLRIILDPDLRIPLDSIVLKDGNSTLIIVDKKSDYLKSPIKKIANVKIMPIPAKNENFDLNHLLKLLGKQGITSIMVEGGSATSSKFIEQKLIDKVMFFIAPKIIGGESALSPIAGIGIKNINDSVKLKNSIVEKIDEDILVTGYPVY